MYIYIYTYVQLVQYLTENTVGIQLLVQFVVERRYCSCFLTFNPLSYFLYKSMHVLSTKGIICNQQNQ